MAGAGQKDLAIGIDIGATKIAAALVDRQGVVVERRRMATCACAGPAAVIERVADVARDLLDAASAPVAGIGVGTPGYVDPEAGVVTNAVNLGWDKVNLVEDLDDRLSKGPAKNSEIWAENDANVMALGEYHYGAAQQCGHFIYASIGSGLGSGIVVDHKLVSGADFRAADLGHLALDPGGRPCACGLRGCVETVVSGPGILASAREFLAGGDPSILAQVRRLTPEVVVEAARTGDPLAVSVFDYTAQWLGQAFACSVALLNPQRIVIGGGMGLAAFDLLNTGIWQEFERRIIPFSYANLEIVRSQVHSSAVGASSLVWHAIQDGHAG
jgi:glucokinase